NAAVLREHANAAWGWLERLVQDLRFGARMLWRAPGVTITAIAILALGIGVNVTAFNIVDLIFFRPLSIRDPHSLVHMTTIFPQGSSSNVAYPAVLYYRDHSGALASVIAVQRTQMTLSEAQPQSARIGLVTANYFSDLGISALYGRVFGSDDGAASAPATAVLGHGFFQSHFGSDATVVGRTIRINQRPVTVVGVLPAGFVGLDPEGAESDDVWLPFEQITYFVPDSKFPASFDQMESGVHMYGRLRPGFKLETAQQALLPLAQQLSQDHPDHLLKGEHLRLSPGGYAAEFSAEDVPAFGLLAALTFLILAATCGNLGNLLLGRAATRQREIGIRLSLGATRGRILRQLMTESLLLGVFGSAAALLMSWYASRLIVSMTGTALSFDLVPDWRTTLFAVAIGILACVLFGLPSARQLSRQRQKSSRVRGLFIAAQVTASCVLLVISALLVHALKRAVSVNPGFDYSQVAVLDPQLYAHSYSDSAAADFYRALKERLLRNSGVESATVVRLQPLGNDISIQRGKSGADGSRFDIYLNEVDGDFFQTMAIPLLRGRTFRPGESDAAIVSESSARRLWPGKDPLQQPYKLGKKTYTVVGVAGNANTISLHDGNAGQAYTPLEEATLTKTFVLARSSRRPEDLAMLLTQTARSIDGQLSPVAHTLKGSFNDKVGDTAQVAGVIGAMGVLALLLATIGLYGVVSYNVAQRTKEIGIRIALGATPGSIVRAVLTNLTAPLAGAIALGLIVAAALSFIMRSYLYGVHNLDPVSYVGSMAVLLGVAALAAFMPARRALKVDPMIALRCE
ncbi:MAG TPA: ABC transporter permease, partial [Candidatus Limnocylindrales bacterium]|nr:ABC transporter permease [Candidatus Limnocylindrales bacterium]